MKFIFLLLLCIPLFSLAQLPKPSAGKVERLQNFPSAFVMPRHVDIWLPENYSPTQKYPVLYMHDGQMLFDPSHTWNQQEWQVDEVLSRLIREKKVPPVIVVGIWNTESNRFTEYFPEKVFSTLPEDLQADAHRQLEHDFSSDAYLKFLVKELKPHIDKTYATSAKREHTFIAGSSMGGLISVYALCEYPKVFGAAACLSTHWIGDPERKDDVIPQAFEQYLNKHLPKPGKHKIYFDRGTETLDSQYGPSQDRMDKLMQRKGFSEENWMSKVFPGHAHDENSWAKRLHIPFEFILNVPKEND